MAARAAGDGEARAARLGRELAARVVQPMRLTGLFAHAVPPGFTADGWMDEAEALARECDVDALDTWGVPDELRTEVELLAADDIKRLLRRPTKVAESRFDWLDDAASERPEWIAAFLEMKTVWHPIGG